jgi:hypothetical protein
MSLLDEFDLDALLNALMIYQQTGRTAHTNLYCTL